MAFVDSYNKYIILMYVVEVIYQDSVLVYIHLWENTLYWSNHFTFSELKDVSSNLKYAMRTSSAILDIQVELW